MVEQVPAAAWDVGCSKPCIAGEWNLGCRFLAVHDRHCSWPSTNFNPTSPVAGRRLPNFKRADHASVTASSANFVLLRHGGIGSPAVTLLPSNCRLGCLEPKIGVHANSSRVTAAQYCGARLSNSQLAACICKLCRNMPSSGVRGCELRFGLGALCLLGYGYRPATSYLKLSGWAHH